MVFTEAIVTPSTPMPHGYKLLKKGYPFMTALCRRKARAAGCKLYVVQAGNRTIGLRAPKRIINEVRDEEQHTRATRRANVASRDDAARRAFKEAIMEQYPEIPSADAEKVLQQTLRKRSGRVGRTSTLSMEDKVRLAVAAHVRHVHTDYDSMVRSGKKREDARKEIYDEVNGVLQGWKGRVGEGEKEDGDLGRRRATRRRPRVTTRAMSRRRPGGAAEEAVDTAVSSIEDPILISSDEEDVLVISSDED